VVPSLVYLLVGRAFALIVKRRRPAPNKPIDRAPEPEIAGLTPSMCHGRIIAQVGHADGAVISRASLRGNCLESGVFGCVGRGRDQLGATLAGRRVVAVEGDCGKHPPGVDVRAA
jgi:hypothetical protein